MTPMPGLKRSSIHRRPTVVAVALILALVLGACGGDDDDATSGTITSDTSTDDTSTDGTDSTPDSVTTPPTDSQPPTDTQPSDDDLPGEPIDLFADAGDVLMVVGVAHDDELNIRAAPGTDQEVVATAGPTADDLVATGRARQLPASIWYELTVDGTTGWASISFLAFEGGTDDATAEFLDGDPPPETETMVEMGELVAAGFASTEPQSSIVQSVAPTVGDLAEVTYDVIGLGDDAVGGVRLHVFATPSESGEGFVLRSIERTGLCTRGSTGEACV